MRTFSHHFREYCTAEARRLYGAPDQSEHQENTEPGIDVTLETQSTPDVIDLPTDSAEGLEDSAFHEALDRMEQAKKEESRQAELQKNMETAVEALVEDIKDMSDTQRGEHVRKFNAEVLNPLGKTLTIIAGKPKISDYTPKGPEDPRIAMKKAKIQQLSAEIHGLEQAMFNMRAKGISRFGQQYIGFTKSMRRRGNVAPEIAKAMRGEIAPQVKPSLEEWKNLGTQLSKKIVELESLKRTPWQSMPLPTPTPTPSPTDTAPIREESTPRFQRRVPVDRMEFSRSLTTLDPETQEQIKSLSPEFQQAIGGIASSLDEQGKTDLRSLTEKLSTGDFNAKVHTPIINPDGTLRTPKDIRAEITSHPEEAKMLEDIASFIESLSPGEKSIMELLIKQAQQLNQGSNSRNFSSPEQIARYTDAWMKAKEKGDEPGMEIAEGLLLMQGVEIDDKGKITPLEDGFGGKGMGFIMGLIMVVDGFLKKIGEKMERKKKEEKKDETPIAEMTEEKKTEEIKKSEKRIGELKKEQTNLKDKIKKGEGELDKEPVETKEKLQEKIDDMKKELKKVEEDIQKEEKKLEELKNVVPTATAEGKDNDQDKPLQKFAMKKEALKLKVRLDIQKHIDSHNPEDLLVRSMKEQLPVFLQVNDAMIDAMHVESNKDGKYRMRFDTPSFVNILQAIYPKTTQESAEETNRKMIASLEKKYGQDASAYRLHTENDQVVSTWVTAQMIEKLDPIMTPEK